MGVNGEAAKNAVLMALIVLVLHVSLVTAEPLVTRHCEPPPSPPRPPRPADAAMMTTNAAAEDIGSGVRERPNADELLKYVFSGEEEKFTSPPVVRPSSAAVSGGGPQAYVSQGQGPVELDL